MQRALEFRRLPELLRYGQKLSVYRAGQQPSLLDLVITNERHFVDRVTINAPLGHSDHCVLTFDFICYWARNPEPQTWIRNFCRADFSGMRIFLNQVKLGPASVEDLYRTIVQKVHEADAMYVPKKPARSRTSRDTEDELAFRKMRNRCKSEIRQWNIRKQATILDLARKNRNVLFKYMRHRRRNKPSAFSLRDRNGEPTSDPIVVSEFYRDHYAGLYSVPASSSHPTLSRRTYERPLTDLVFTVEDIRQLLHKINPFCALGPDEVHPRILKETSYTLATQFHLLFRQSLDEGHLPSVWNEAITDMSFSGVLIEGTPDYQDFTEIARNIPAGPEHYLTRRNIRRHVKVSVQAECEVWWTQIAKGMEEAQLIRATRPPKPPVSETIKDRKGVTVSNKEEHIDRWAEYFEQKLAWSTAGTHLEPTEMFNAYPYQVGYCLIRVVCPTCNYTGYCAFTAVFLMNDQILFDKIVRQNRSPCGKTSSACVFIDASVLSKFALISSLLLHRIEIENYAYSTSGIQEGVDGPQSMKANRNFDIFPLF
ncbi:hypothetical protein CLF_111774 [Clonorchis sinensis]|uniref:Endonuclease/exonuclease/phosphatase domain-containing protein n=1 Tax=Clonorchis sinensis TaxID=79923 RepID=G7YLY9_CLOSI|nr:hypothetical protein CLF_111774 [Clonorchis sinensis]